MLRGKKCYGLPSRYDFSIHPTETWLAMERLVKIGLVRTIGLSNFNSEQITDILDRGSIVPAVNQANMQN